MADAAIAQLADDLIRLQALGGDPMSWAVYYLRRDPWDLRQRLYDHVQSSLRPLTLVPMGHTKSTTVPETLVPMFACNFPDIRMGIVSEARERALEISDYSRNQLDLNERIIQDYGHLRGPVWTQDKWTRLGRPPGPHLSHPTCKALGVGSRVTGSRWDVLFADDLVTIDNSQTEHQRQKVIRYWTVKLLSRMDNNEHRPWPYGGVFTVGNLFHPRDAYSHMMETAKAAGVERDEFTTSVLRLEAYTDEARTKVLLPELWSVRSLEARRREMGATAFELAFMNNPGGMENAPFAEELFTYWTEDVTRVSHDRVWPVYRLPPRSKLRIRAGWDFGGQFQGNDYTACAVVGIHRATGRYYWLQFLYGNWTPSQRIEKALLVMHKWRPREQLMERNGFQLELAQEIAREHPELMRTIIPVQTGPTLSKDARILAGLEPAFTARRHVFPEFGSEEVLAMIQQFPGHRYKDVLDAMEIAGRDLSKNAPPKRAGKSVRKPLLQ